MAKRVYTGSAFYNQVTLTFDLFDLWINGLRGSAIHLNCMSTMFGVDSLDVIFWSENIHT